MKDHAISEAQEGLATTHAPVETGTYDPDRWMEVQSFVPDPNHHSRLPGQTTKAQAIATVCNALRLIGRREIEISAWRLIADITEREAWTAPDRSPVNWRRQCDLARELGISERHFRRIETRLAALGVLARATADNGYRGRRSGQSYAVPVSCGLSLEPAIRNFRALAGIVEEAAHAEGDPAAEGAGSTHRAQARRDPRRVRVGHRDATLGEGTPRRDRRLPPSGLPPRRGVRRAGTMDRRACRPGGGDPRGADAPLRDWRRLRRGSARSTAGRPRERRLTLGRGTDACGKRRESASYVRRTGLGSPAAYTT